MSRFYTDAQLQQMVEQFEVQGYLRVEDALSLEQVARFNKAVDRHLEAYPDDWIELSDSFCEGTNVLPHTSDFDEAIENPKTLDIVRAIIGDQITFEEFAIMLRNPTENLAEVKGWHRDIVREFDRRMEIDAVSVLMYLTDVTESDHCFSIVPETHNRLVDTNPLDVPLDAGFDITGPAGTAVIFHARAIPYGAAEIGQHAAQHVAGVLLALARPTNGRMVGNPATALREAGPNIAAKALCEMECHQHPRRCRQTPS